MVNFYNEDDEFKGKRKELCRNINRLFEYQLRLKSNEPDNHRITCNITNLREIIDIQINDIIRMARDYNINPDNDDISRIIYLVKKSKNKKDLVDINFIKNLSNVFGFIDALCIFLKVNQIGLDKRYIFLAFIHGANSAEKSLTSLKLIFNHLPSLKSLIEIVIGRRSRSHIRQWIEEFNKDLEIFIIAILKQKILNKYTSSKISHLLTLISFFYITYQKDYLSAMVAFPFYEPGCRKLAFNFSNVISNPYSLFSLDNNKNWLAELDGKELLRKFGKLSSVCLVSIISFMETRSPILALLSFTMALIFQLQADALTDELRIHYP